jgi:hypothetical protein
VRFVDDEEKILKSLHRLEADKGFEVFLAGSAGDDGS